jgi:hypothetical protein
MTPVHQITMLKFIKNLSMLSTTLESLHSADAIESLIDLLSYSRRKSTLHFREISNQVLNTMFNLCRLSKERQEHAAVGGIIPILLKIMKTDRPPKEFVLPILCDMAHSGRTGRRYLWNNKGLDFYVTLLADQYWQVTALDAILVWLQEETANVERHLIDGSFTKSIVACFNTNKLQPPRTPCQASSSVTISCGIARRTGNVCRHRSASWSQKGRRPAKPFASRPHHYGRVRTRRHWCWQRKQHSQHQASAVAAGYDPDPRRKRLCPSSQEPSQRAGQVAGRGCRFSGRHELQRQCRDTTRR